MALSPAVTGTVLAVASVLAVLEATFLIIPGPWGDVPAPVYLFTLAVAITACLAHLLAHAIDHIRAHIRGVEDRVEARLDSHELLDLDRALAVGARRTHPPHHRARRRSRRRADSNVFDLN